MRRLPRTASRLSDVPQGALSGSSAAPGRDSCRLASAPVYVAVARRRGGFCWPGGYCFAQLLWSVMNLRHSVRGLIVDDDENLLLYRFTVPTGLTVWGAPGGGVERGESLLDGLARELDEETGLQDIGQPVHVWHQEVHDLDLIGGWDGVVNDYYMIRTSQFEPSGSMSMDELAAERVEHFGWWSSQRLLAHHGHEVFGPRQLPRLYTDLLALGPPLIPLPLDL